MNIASYRLNEHLAKANIFSWRLMAIQGSRYDRNVGLLIDYLFIRKHHPKFDKFRRAKRERLIFDVAEPLMRDVYLPAEASGRH